MARDLGAIQTGGRDLGAIQSDAGGGAPNEGSGNCNAVGVCTGSGSTLKSGSGNVSAVGTLTGTGLSVHSGSGNCNAVGSLVGTGIAPTLDEQTGTGTVSAIGVLTGTGTAVRSGSGSLAVVGTLVGTGAAVKSGSGSFLAVGRLTGTGENGEVAEAVNVLFFDVTATRLLSFDVTATRVIQFEDDTVARPYVGDEGTKILLRARDESGGIISLAGADEVLLVLRRPAGDLLELPAENETDGTDGKAFALSDADTFNSGGHFEAWLKPTLDGDTFRTDAVSFMVYE